MQKFKVAFPLFILGSVSFAISTSLSDIQHHASHLFSVLLLHAIFLAYLWKPKLQVQTQRGVFTGLVFFSLFVLVSSRVIPTGLLLDHHETHTQTTGHESSQHSCCVPALPTMTLNEIVKMPDFEKKTIAEPKLLHTSRFISQRSSRSPPQG